MLKTKIQHCPITDEIHRIFTIQKKDYITFTPHTLPELPKFSIGLIVGNSGSGKSILLNNFGTMQKIKWSEAAIASNFEDYIDAESRLLGAGLSSVPNWLKPYNILSNGQKYRADVARQIESNVVFDEFTSVIDRNTALSLSASLSSYIKNNNLTNIVFATPHYDIIPFLNPDWVYDCNKRSLIFNEEKVKSEPMIKFKI